MKLLFVSVLTLLTAAFLYGQLASSNAHLRTLNKPRLLLDTVPAYLMVSDNPDVSGLEKLYVVPGYVVIGSGTQYLSSNFIPLTDVIVWDIKRK